MVSKGSGIYLNLRFAVFVHSIFEMELFTVFLYSIKVFALEQFSAVCEISKMHSFNVTGTVFSRTHTASLLLEYWSSHTSHWYNCQLFVKHIKVSSELVLLYINLDGTQMCHYESSINNVS